MKGFGWILEAGAALSCHAGDPEATLRELADGWIHPARIFRSHTRWWWPGNALTREMKAKDLPHPGLMGPVWIQICNTGVNE